MGENLPCIKHTEQIKTLFNQDEFANKRIDGMEGKIDDMTDMKLTMNTIALTMKNIQDHNVRQDAWNKDMFEKQSNLNERQNNTLDRINENLNKLNAGQDKLEGQVTELKQRVDENESKHSVDLRDLEKKKYTDIFIKYVLPTGGGLIILMELIRIWKG